ncbi:hypothetical protein ABT369_09225 [Dactylosporangium sp. NPDC000244]|uniref:hypothetical protein n=1 Tax=Dactylosporangium sp. NPDC000244 TaxID=3154365 RepID=UPI0033180C35
MIGSEVNGVPALQEGYSGFTPTELPASLLAVAGAPPAVAGLPTGIALAAVGQAVGGAFAAFMAKTTEWMVADAAAVKTAAVDYTAADATSAVKVTTVTAHDVASALKVATKAVTVVGKAIGVAQKAESLVHPTTT